MADSPSTEARNAANAAVNNATSQPSNTGSAHPSPAGSPAPAPAGTAQASPSRLPAELAGKSVDEVAAYYSDRYKDYDDIKGKYEKVSKYESLGLPPDDAKQTIEFAANLVREMQSGRRLAWDAQNGRIVYADGPQAGQAAQPQDAQAQTQNPFDDNYALLPPQEQAQRMSEYVLNQRMMPQINKLVEGYNRDVKNQFDQINRMVAQQMETLFTAFELAQNNPGKIKPRDLLQRATELAQNKDYLAMAANQMLSPAQQAEEIERQVAARLAEEEAKRNQNGSPMLSPIGYSSHTRMGQGKPSSMGELRHQIINGWRQNGTSR